MSNRRAEILAAAAELFAKNGFNRTTVREIADSVGILSGSLYHHFDSKEEMVQEILAAYFDELTARWNAVLAENSDPQTQFAGLFREALVTVDKHTAAARLFTNEWRELRPLTDFAERWRRSEQLWIDVIEAAIAKGQFRADIEPALVFSIAIDLIRGLSGWYHLGVRYSMDLLIDSYTQVLLEGVRVHDAAAAPIDNEAELSRA